MMLTVMREMWCDRMDVALDMHMRESMAGQQRLLGGMQHLGVFAMQHAT